MTAPWVLALLCAELVLATSVRVRGVAAVVHGAPLDLTGLLDIVGLVLCPVLAVVCVRTARAVQAARLQARWARQELADVRAMSAEWIWTIGLDGTLLASNDAIGKILGFGADEVLGSSAFNLMHPESRDVLVGALEHAVTTGDGWADRTSRWRARDGSHRHLRSCGAVVFDGDGVVVAVRGTSRDVTAELEVATEPAVGSASRTRAAHRHRIERVLAEPSLIDIVYQPVVRLRDGRTTGLEALSRFRCLPTRPPDSWFAEAADVGLGDRLELLAIRRATANLAAMPADTYLGVNASPATICDPGLREILDAMPGDRIVLEVTEHAAVRDYDRLEHHLDLLRQTGVRVAIDDAGAGYSSLRHILRLSPDFIKLDRAIITGIDADPVRRALTAAMTAFANEVGATLIAEGVEREAELRVLQEIGVHSAQGYLLGRPAPLEALARQLAADRQPVPSITEP